MRFPLCLTSSLLLLPFLLSVARAADSVVVFNEIHYHPADPLNDTEWIELRNLMGVNVDMSKWELEGGVNVTFPEGTILDGHGFLVIAANPGHASLAGRNVLSVPFTGQLANSGESIRLVNNNDRTMDDVNYGDDNDWPVGPDGSGATLAKRDQNSADARPANWVASPEVGGTPGAANFPLAGQPPVTTPILTLASSWKYRDTPSTPPSGWNANAFDDNGWPIGNSVLYAGSAAPTGAGDGLVGYWPLEETSGTSAPNAVVGGATAQLFGAVTWLNDGTRGRVLSFPGGGAYADAGATTIPRMTLANDFTWSFWSYSQQPANNNVILGNRYSPSGADFSPREFIKFTTTQFEFHRNAVGENVAYAAIPQTIWIHHALVKKGAELSYFRNGVAAGSQTISLGLNNPQPLYFGGDRASESWAGRLDDPALWTKALPATSVAGLANGTYTPLTAPTVAGGASGNLGDQLALGSSAFYFRKSFPYSGNPSRTTLNLQLLVDDGAVVYLNGMEVHRANMPGGAVTHGTFASSTVTDATLSSGITIPGTQLVQGNNVIAVEVHQEGAASPDMVFGAILTATETPPEPGDFTQSIVLNEISAASAPNFRIELANTGTAGIDLAGFVIRSSSGASKTLGAGSLEAGGFLALDAATLGFTPVSGDRLFLFKPGAIELVDARQVTNRLRGRSGDRWIYPSGATFGSANQFALNADIAINEIMYNPRPLQGTADVPATFQTTTLLNWNATWRYNEEGSDLGPTWEMSAHPIGGEWQSGVGPLGYENSIGIPVTPIATPLRNPNLNPTFVVTYYFETDFTLTAQQLAAITELQLTHEIDDGAIFYLNGIEIDRFKMNSEPTTAATQANAGGEAVVTGPYAPSNAASYLVAGMNRLSVEVHQNGTASSDVVFGLKLDAREQLTPFIPGLPFRNSDEQWVELTNRGAAPVNLGGWTLSDGVGFTFPANTLLGPGEFLVVARNPTSLSTKNPGIPIVGPWSGSLARGGERLRLVDATGNPADEVRYADGGEWPGTADAGGSSLELRDPRADNAVAGSWSASDESARRTWQTYTYTATAMNGQGDPTQYNEFVMGLLDEGEILIDDISVIEDPNGANRQLIQNGDFSAGTTAFWRMLGTHRHVEVIDDPDSPGNKVLHLEASGPTEHMHNHAETTLKAGAAFVTINSTLQYRISFRAKWVSGSNQLNTRLYFNRCARTTLLDAQPDGGTPGAVNSTRVPNAGPTGSGLTHTPAVPAAGAPATVSINAADPDGVASATLFYAVNGAAFISTPMTNAGDGRFTGIVPGQAAAAKVQFYVSIQDTLGATTFLPSGGPESRAMIPWADGQANLDYGDCQPNNFRIVMLTADSDFMHTNTQVMSNDRLPCTIIYNESEIYYDCGVRLKGSERGRNQTVRVGFSIGFPDDHPFLGAHATVAIDRSGSGNQFSQKEILVKHGINHAGGGIPGMEDDLIRVIAPRTAHTGSAMFLKSRYDNEWLNNQFPNGSDGRMFEYELIYYPTTTTGGVEGLKLPEPDAVAGVAVRTLGSLTNKELYRWHWLIDTNTDADDYSGMIGMLEAFGMSGAAYLSTMQARVDVDQFLRAFAVQTLFGIGDSYSSGAQHNLLIYFRPTDGKAMFFPWDMDFTFNLGETAGVVNNGDLSNMINASPAYKRAYYGHLRDIIATTFNASYMGPWATHYSCFLPSENLSGFTSYIGNRASYVTGLINAAVANVTFGITTPDGTTANGTFATVEGDAWINVRELRLPGSNSPLTVTWLDDNSWRVSVPVVPGANQVIIQAFGFQGELIGSSTVNITGTGSIFPANASNFAISELMYHPAPPTVAEQNAGYLDGEDFEYLELTNTSTTATIDVDGVRLTDGIVFDLVPRTLAPGERIVLARNPGAYIARYGVTSAMAGSYGGSTSPTLSNGGERILLLAADTSPIADFTYDDAAPWPVDADGNGYSLTLMCPGVNDPADPRSWRSSALGGSPGFDDAIPLGAWMTANGVADLLSDHDHDNLPALFEYLAGTSPNLPGPGTVARAELVALGDATYPVVSMRQIIGADDARLDANVSTTLASWLANDPADVMFLGRTNNGDGTETIRFRAALPVNGTRQFLRLEAEAKPFTP